MSISAERLVADRPEKRREAALTDRCQGEASIRHNNTVMLPAAFPRLTRIESKLADLDTLGIDRQLVSPSPAQYFYWAEPRLSEEIVATQNDEIAALRDACPDRISALGTVALQHPLLAATQLRHAVGTLRLYGVQICTSVGDIELSDPSLDPFWQAAEDTRALIFLHPFGSSLGTRLDRWYLSNTIGQPIETTIALSHLIFGGVLDRFPKLKILAAHGGGYLPFYAGRSDHAYLARPEAQGIKELPRSYLRRIYFDTVTHDPRMIGALVDLVGIDQVLFGTDYPFDMGDYRVADLIDAVPDLGEGGRAKLLGANAEALLSSIHS